MVTDKLRRYAAAKREMMPSVEHDKVAIWTIEPKHHSSRRDDENGR
jgi:transposase-like protein